MTDEQVNKLLYAIALNISVAIHKPEIKADNVDDARKIIKVNESWANQLYEYLKEKR